MTVKRITRRRFLKTTGIGSAVMAMGSSSRVQGAMISIDEAMILLGGFTWIGHASFSIQDRQTMIYFDPYQVPNSSPKADLICVSHSHSDHCDATSVRKIIKDGTHIVTEPESAAKLRSITDNITIVAPGDDIVIDGIRIEAVPAYNINKTNHPKSKNWLGFVLTLSDGRRVYHAGDTDNIPEMAGIDTDVAMLPVGGTYTASASEAVDAAKIIQPLVAVPMHYGTIIGSVRDAEKFKQDLDGLIQTVIFEPGQTVPPAVTKSMKWNVY